MAGESKSPMPVVTPDWTRLAADAVRGQQPPSDRDLEIAPCWTVGDWKNLKLDPKKPNSEDWKTALKIFEARIRGRFLDPADVLIAHEISQNRRTFGFAILAIDFLVIETLQGFREGRKDHRGKGVSEGLVVEFLNCWEAFTDCLSDQNKDKAKDYAKKVYGGYRCGLHHTGSTDGELRILAIGPTFEIKSETDITINRTRFHEELKHEFNRDIDTLRSSGEMGKERRDNLIKKMNTICDSETGKRRQPSRPKKFSNDR